mgnify:CR=1 FL=1
MAEVSSYYNIGPMAAVAGAVADCVGQLLMKSQTDVIIENGGDSAKFIEKAKDPDDPFRLMGFGHRVYRVEDPRTTHLRVQLKQDKNRLWVLASVNESVKPRE